MTFNLFFQTRSNAPALECVSCRSSGKFFNLHKIENVFIIICDFNQLLGESQSCKFKTIFCACRLSDWVGITTLEHGNESETNQVLEYGHEKLQRKKLDMIAANQVGQALGFEQDDNTLTVLWKNGEQVLPRCSKIELAQQLVTLVSEHFHAQRAAKTL